MTTTRDIAGTGITPQRVNQVNGSPYGDKSLNNYLSAAAFASPVAGAYGDQKNNGIEGPGFWTVDVALSRLGSFVVCFTIHYFPFRARYLGKTAAFTSADLVLGRGHDARSRGATEGFFRRIGPGSAWKMSSLFEN